MKTIGFKDIPQGWIMATREGLLHGKRNAGAAIICLALLVFEKESRDQARTRYRRQLLTDEGAPRCDRVFVFSDESAPQHRRPSYIAFLNTLVFPLTFLPVLAGALVGDKPLRFDMLFAAIATCGLLTFLCALRLAEVRSPARAS